MIKQVMINGIQVFNIDMLEEADLVYDFEDPGGDEDMDMDMDIDDDMIS